MDRFHHQYWESTLRLMQQADSEDDLRTVSGAGHVQIPPSSRARSRCVNCDKFLLKNTTDAVWCQGCNAAVYCDHDCRGEDRPIHENFCRAINIHRARVARISSELTLLNNGVLDAFDRSDGMVFWIADRRRGLGSVGEDYLEKRMGLVYSYLAEAAVRAARSAEGIEDETTTSQETKSGSGRWNLNTIELALDDCIDILHLDPVKAGSAVRTYICHCLLVLERYQDLYDFVKYWNVLPHKLRDIHRQSASSDWDESMVSLLGPTAFLNWKDPQRLFEDQSQLALRLPSRRPDRITVPSSSRNVPAVPETVILTFPGPSQSEIVQVLYLALAKLQVYSTITCIRFVQSFLPIESEFLASNVAGYLGLKHEWMATNPLTILTHCRELLNFAETSLGGILSHSLIRNYLDDVGYGSFLNRRGDRILSESRMAMFLLQTAWKSNPFAWNFLSCFVDTIGTSNAVLTPRNNKAQFILDSVYREYIKGTIAESRYQQGLEFYEQEKLYLLNMEERENRWSESCKTNYSVSRILDLFANNIFESQEMIATFYGIPFEFDDFDDWVELEKKLACEYFDQVRNRPEVRQLLKEHPLFASFVEDTSSEVTNSVRLDDILNFMGVEGLASELNLRLLFGNDAWL